MNIQSLRLLPFLIASAISFSQIQAVSAEECISRGQLQELSEDFDQFNEFLAPSPTQQTFCSEDLGDRWFQISKSLLLLKYATPNEPQVDQEDGLTYKAIEERDWWAYFTKRAQKFEDGTRCSPGVVAYVMPWFDRGTIHLCPPFFKNNRSSQASTLMHEVRHFDGHGHVTCTRGNEEGSSGACDETITSRGSYAISVQTLVGLARSEKTENNQRVLLESQAVYMAYNKFNEVPELKMNHFVLLSDSEGGIYRWDTEDHNISHVADAEGPVSLRNSFNKVTAYPLDPQLDAFRIDNGFEEFIENPGLFAVHYNSESVEERAKYNSVMYHGDGGLLKDNSLFSLCDNKSLAEKDLSSIGSFSQMIALPEGDEGFDRKTYLLEKSGRIYSMACKSQNSSEVLVAETELSVRGKIVSSFPLAGTQYAVLKSGHLAELTLNGNVFRPRALDLYFARADWVSAAPFTVAQIFEDED